MSLAPWVLLAATSTALLRRRGPPPPGMSLDHVDTPAGYDAREPARGRLAPWPPAIPARGWGDVLWRTVMEIPRDRLPAVAGGVTFYSLLSAFPALGVFVSVYGLVADVSTVRRQLEQIAAFVPDEVLGLIAGQMMALAERPDSSLGVAFAVSLALSLWTAKTGVAALLDGLNIAYDEEEKRPYVLRTLQVYGATFAAILLLAVFVGLLVGAPIVLERVGLGRVLAIYGPMRWVAALVLAFGALALLYRHGPSRATPQWRWVWCGAAVGAVMWICGSLGFSWYVNSVANYDVTYGSLGAAVVLMLWIWFSVMVVLVGAELNAEIEHQTALDSTVGPVKPIGRRGAVVADTVGLSIDARAAIGKAFNSRQRQARRLFHRFAR
ncbi:MAG: YihY/virulence factor BrkB family protein [Phenylobacterium sp.]|uniref:YihY/virulence factor BrkB family protein n=1 Tax=Phenylobacterium sp. TaxID=1871053 RepID=UPI00391C1C6E